MRQRRGNHSEDAGNAWPPAPQNVDAPRKAKRSTMLSCLIGTAIFTIIVIITLIVIYLVWRAKFEYDCAHGSNSSFCL